MNMSKRKCKNIPQNTSYQHSVPSSTVGVGKRWICCKRQKIAKKITKNITIVNGFSHFLTEKNHKFNFTRTR